MADWSCLPNLREPDIDWCADDRLDCCLDDSRRREPGVCSATFLLVPRPRRPEVDAGAMEDDSREGESRRANLGLDCGLTTLLGEGYLECGCDLRRRRIDNGWLAQSRMNRGGSMLLGKPYSRAGIDNCGIGDFGRTQFSTRRGWTMRFRA